MDTRLDTVKTSSKELVHEECQFLVNKIADAVTKSNDNKIAKPDKNSKNVGEIIVLPEERDAMLNKLRQVLL